MSSPNILNGTAVNFGIVGLAASGTGLGTFIPQDIDHSVEASVDIIRDGTGRRVEKTWYDQIAKAKLRYVVKGSGLADAITQSTLPAIGVFINISACTNYPALVGSNWEVVNARAVKSNTKAHMVEVDLEAADGITAVASA